MMSWYADWAWFSMVLLWIVIVGAVIYAVVRLANDDSRRDLHPH